MKLLQFTIHNSQFTFNSQFLFINVCKLLNDNLLKIVKCKMKIASEGGLG